MKQSTAATLSGHLLQEASKFHMYPARVYRTRSNLDAQKIHDTILAMLVEWRETFAPWPQNDPDTAAHERCDKILTSPVLLDEFYCRDLLKAVPGIVDSPSRVSPTPNWCISGRLPNVTYLGYRRLQWRWRVRPSKIAFGRSSLSSGAGRL